MSDVQLCCRAARGLERRFSYFYCSEFCADPAGPVTTNFHNRSIKERIDRLYRERLQRLAPYARRLSDLGWPAASPGLAATHAD
jgi:hypothetical protein